ncbi:hypothetical protein HII36_09670 [Nonomuraea sp. NN258]|uniref:tetratricopeptide repeat protein n=1 Tax=Nonomuraea antri TaxID=2730852 RepID=UPI001569BB08|nr:tetratricopeptide repeat protein [Nonomuraea antri]NRQ32104.1 hypothetical protein [Nonomuraea antri]
MPVLGLGNDVAPAEVHFQQAANSSVDDLVIVGQCLTGTRRLFIGVRRDPVIGPKNSPFIALLVDYLRMLEQHRPEFDADRWRLALAVAGPHTASQEVKKLAEFARGQPDDQAFRAAVDVPRAVSGNVRRRLELMDAVVVAAAAQGGLPVANELTWRLLKALRILDLRLEGDDAIDRTNLIQHLMARAPNVAAADDLWRYLVSLSAGYATKSAQVNRAMLLRDLGSRLPVLEAASLQAPDQQEFDDRLMNLPPVHAARLRQVWRDDQPSTWRLVTALTTIETSPIEVIRSWENSTPSWLLDAPWQIQVAAADLAVGYGGRFLAAALFRAAAAGEAERRGYWLARSVILYDDGERPADAAAALAELRSPGTALNGYSRAVDALFRGDAATASRELSSWHPQDPNDRGNRVALLLRVMSTVDGAIVINRTTLDKGIQLLCSVLRDEWFTGLAVACARLLLLRVRRSESTNSDGDLREAKRLALRARNDRRTYRGDSVEPTELACQAAALSSDPRAAIAIGTLADDGATEDEAASSTVREYVAISAIQLGDLALAEDCISHVTHAARRARLDALLAEARGNDAQPYWRHAVHLADDDEQLAEGLAGMAHSGAAVLPRIDEFAARQPEAANEIRALQELKTGDAKTAISRLRTRRRVSAGAAFTLAKAYQAIGDVEKQVRTLLDAAEDFREPSFRLNAAEVLARAGRGPEAEQELNALLAAAPGDWSDRLDALRLAAELAYADHKPERASELLETALRIQPDHAETRWALVRMRLQRGDLDEAWVALSNAPRPLEPASISEGELWVHLHRRFGDPEETTSGCLRLLRRFGDSEQFSAFVLTNLIMPGPWSEGRTEAQIAQMHAQMSLFFYRWPESRLIERLETTDLEALAEELTNRVRPSDEALLERRRLVRGLLLGVLPLSILAQATRRSLAEVTLRHGVSVLPARHPDPQEIAACAATAATSIDQDLVVDTSALVSFITLPQDVREAVTRCFARVMTTDDVKRDALVAHETLLLRSTDTLFYDERAQARRSASISDDEADRLALEARKLLESVDALARHPRPVPHVIETHGFAALSAWASPADLARARDIALWSDDPSLRAIARRFNLHATSTPAIVRHLANTGVITAKQHEDTIRTFIRAGIGMFPVEERRLLELAEEDRWTPGCVAAVLSQPSAWANTVATATLFSKILAQARTQSPEGIQAWLYQATKGAVLASRNGIAASESAARLLTLALHVAAAQGERAGQLVAACREALDYVADPDQPAIPDPLPTCAVLLRDSYSKALAFGLATRYVIGTFSALSESDRGAVVKALLR